MALGRNPVQGIKIGGPDVGSLGQSHARVGQCPGSRKSISKKLRPHSTLCARSAGTRSRQIKSAASILSVSNDLNAASDGRIPRMASTERKHIKIAKEARVIVKVGKHSNRLHIDVTLTPDQEKRLLKMLRKRNPEKK